MVLAACGPDAAEIELVIVPHKDGCGQVDPTSITITGLGESGAVSRSLSPDEGRVRITDFPSDLRQLALEVTGAAGDAIGKTAPFTVATAPDRLPVAIARLEETCAVGNLVHARKRPVVAAAGAGALVVGGFDMADVEVHAAEYFDPLAGGFVELVTPTSMSFGGAATAPLPDGRVFVLGGLPFGGYVVFDPTQTPPAFQTPGAFAPPRAYAQVVALDDHTVLIAGGCGALAAGGTACDSGMAQRGVTILDLDTGNTMDRPSLQLARAGGVASLQHSALGEAIVALAGGVGDDGMALADVERISLGLTPGTLDTTENAPGLATVLDSGAILTAFAPAGEPASNAAAIVVPGRSDAAMIPSPGPARGGAVMVALEDGTAIAIGGVIATALPPPDPAFAVAAPILYRPMQGWRAAGAALPTGDALLQHAAARLADGSVLVVGGVEMDTDGVTPTSVSINAAYRYRPSLLGPFEPGAAVTPSTNESDRVQLTPFDADNITRPDGDLVVRSVTGLGNWVLVSGPRFSDGRLDVAVAVLDQGGGFGLIARAASPDDRIDVVLVPQVRPTVTRLVAGAVTPLCEGDDVFPTVTGTAALSISMSIEGRTLRVTSGGDPVIAECDLGDDAGADGLWGVSAVGGNTSIRIDTVLVERGTR